MRVEADCKLYANNFGLVRTSSTSSTTLHLQFKGKLHLFLDKNYFLPLCDEIFNVMFKCKLFIRPTTKWSIWCPFISSQLFNCSNVFCSCFTMFISWIRHWVSLTWTNRSKQWTVINLGVCFPVWLTSLISVDRWWLPDIWNMFNQCLFVTLVTCNTGFVVSVAVVDLLTSSDVGRVSM